MQTSPSVFGPPFDLCDGFERRRRKKKDDLYGWTGTELEMLVQRGLNDTLNHKTDKHTSPPSFSTDLCTYLFLPNQISQMHR